LKSESHFFYHNAQLCLVILVPSTGQNLYQVYTKIPNSVSKNVQGYLTTLTPIITWILKSIISSKS